MHLDRNTAFLRGFSRDAIFRLSTFLFFLVLFGCTENLENFGPQTEGSSVPIPVHDRVVVLNEGNFMFGNGSVSVVDLQSGEVVNQVFQNRNGFPLGDVPQSLLFHEDEGFVVVNNSGKIEVVDRSDFTSIHTISGFNSPRQMAIVSQNPLRGWVTDLYAQKIWVVDLEQKNILHSIPFSGWGENIVVFENEAIVLNKTDSILHVFQIDSEIEIDSVKVDKGISDMAQWSETELAILSPSGAYLWNSNSRVLDTLMLFSTYRNPVKLAIDKTLNRLYFLENDVYVIDLSSNQPKLEIIIDKTLAYNYYNISINKETSQVFLTNTKDFVQAGSLLVYDIYGNKLFEFPMGINPQWIVFD